MKLSTCLVFVSAVFGLAACASNPFSSYHQQSATTLGKIYAGNLNQALAVESRDDILFYLEQGSLQRFNSNYPRSNEYFSIAEQGVENWANSWLSTSGGQLSTSATSMLLNDNANAYLPRGYERTFLTTYHALNHLDLNNWDNARIEIKRMYQIEQATENYNQALYNEAQIDARKQQQNREQNYLSQQILKKYDFSDINTPQVLALKNSYQNAFSHYLAGFVFEALNEPSLARPGYVKAGQLNPTNKLIQTSIDNIDNNVQPTAKVSDVLIVEEIGHAPLIKSEEAHIPINMNFSNNKNSCVNVINVFFPRLIPDSINREAAPIQIDNTHYTPELMVDVNLMAARALHDDIPHLIARNVSAAIRNIATSQAACASGGNLGSLLSLGTSIGGMLLDHADERSWTMLPSKIYINRTRLSYGAHQISVWVNGRYVTQMLNLSAPYHIITFRIMGNQIFFNQQL